MSWLRLIHTLMFSDEDDDDDDGPAFTQYTS